MISEKAGSFRKHSDGLYFDGRDDKTVIMDADEDESHCREKNKGRARTILLAINV